MDSIREMVNFQRRQYVQRRTSRGTQDATAVGSCQVTSETLQILEPTSKKLSSIETQRVMSVFDNGIKKIELITLLKQVINNLGRFKVSLGTEAVELLLTHKVIMESFDEIKAATVKLLQEEEEEEEFEDQFDTSCVPEQSETETETDTDNEILQKQMVQSGIIEETPSLHYSSSSSKRKEAALNNLQFVAGQLQASCRDILRAFHKSPTCKSVMELILKEYHNSRNHSGDKFISYLYKLREQGMSRLLMTAIEHEEKTKYVHEVYQRERRNAAKIKKLESNLRAAYDDMQSYINKKNEIIHKIQDELDHVESQADEHYRRTRTEAEKQIISDMQLNESKMARLQQERTNLKNRHRDLLEMNKNAEMDLRRRKFKIETELDNWIHKYDQDMGSRQQACEEIEVVYSEEREQLRELEEVFKGMETTYKQIMEERRLKKEADEIARKEHQQRLNAAYILQRFWRRYGTPPKKKKKKKGKKK